MQRGWVSNFEFFLILLESMYVPRVVIFDLKGNFLVQSF